MADTAPAPAPALPIAPLSEQDTKKIRFGLLVAASVGFAAAWIIFSRKKKSK